MKYLVDTNILLSYPEFVLQADIDILLTYKVICELDNKKYEPGTIGLASRTVTRWLDEANKAGSLESGVDTSSGNRVYVIMDDSLDMPTDDALIQVGVQLKSVGTEFVLLSNDVNVRIKGSISGLETSGWGAARKESTQNQCLPEIEVADEVINKLYASGELPLLPSWDVVANGYVMLRSDIRTTTTAVCRREGDIIKVVGGKKKLFGISHRNVDQLCAIDALARDLPLVTLVGRAGSGKTLLAVAAALEALLEKRTVDNIVIIRPTIAVGKDVGFLPGPQPLDAKILTPTGWTTMGQIQKGSYVIGRDGAPTKVLDIFPKGKKPVYRITTVDGTSTEACADHLWLTQTREERKRNRPGSIRTTAEIMKTLNRNGKPNHFLPRNEAVQFEAKELPIPPYTLGVLLGDGSIANSISFASMDSDIVERVASEMGDFGCRVSKSGETISYNIANQDGTWSFNKKTAQKVKISGPGVQEQTFRSVGVAAEELGIHRATLGSRCADNLTIDGISYEFNEPEMLWTNKIKNSLAELGLLGKKATNKFIPKEYLYGATVEQRLALLQGLMDTDGTIKKNGESSYCTTSLQLAKDIQELVRSLGGKVNIRKPRNRIGKTSKLNGRDIITKHLSYEFNVTLLNMNPFHLKRKADRHLVAKDPASRKRPFMHGLSISSIELTGQKEVQCILVENEEHLYITDDYIVTHNTLEDKMAAWAGPIYDNLEVLMNGKGKNLDLYIESGAISIQPTTFMRGRSLNKTFVLLDEGQSLTRHEMKTIATRIGSQGRLVVTGDLDQIDNPRVSSSDNGMSILIEAFHGTEWASCINLIRGERSDFASAAADRL